MIDTLKIECLLQSLGEYVEAVADLKTRMANYDGYSPDYVFSNEISRKAWLADAFRKRLDEYIDARIAAALAEHKP